MSNKTKVIAQKQANDAYSKQSCPRPKWRVINGLRNANTTHGSIEHLQNDDKQVMVNDKDKANLFNEKFIQLGAFTGPNKTIKTKAPEHNAKFQFRFATEYDVCKALQSLNVNKPMGHRQSQHGHSKMPLT